MNEQSGVYEGVRCSVNTVLFVAFAWAPQIVLAPEQDEQEGYVGSSLH
jgi:hypothetical protein